MSHDLYTWSKIEDRYDKGNLFANLINSRSTVILFLIVSWEGFRFVFEEETKKFVKWKKNVDRSFFILPLPVIF